MQNAMVQTPMLSTMIFKTAQVNIMKEVEPNICREIYRKDRLART